MHVLANESKPSILYLRGNGSVLNAGRLAHSRVVYNLVKADLEDICARNVKELCGPLNP